MHSNGVCVHVGKPVGLLCSEASTPEQGKESALPFLHPLHKKLCKLSEKMLVCLILAGSMDHSVVDGSFNPNPAGRPTLAISSLLLQFHALYISHHQNLTGDLGVAVPSSREAEAGRGR